jgi:hypothetical protein
MSTHHVKLNLKKGYYFTKFQQRVGQIVGEYKGTTG